MLKRMFGSKMEDVVRVWRRLHNVEFHNLYASSYIIREVKSKKVRMAEHVACMGEMRNS
jgi:hypothetical protein